MCQTVWFKCHGHVPELYLCNVDLDIEAAVAAGFGVRRHG
jgi:hypothetical protein